MFTQSAATVRMFGGLYNLCKERGLKPVMELGIPAGGCSARELAVKLDLPLEKIEAVFVNHRACGLDCAIQSGDRVAFVPTGIPSPERLLLGIYRAGLSGVHGGRELSGSSEKTRES
jgi:molybdopterin converting factor small subunit